MKQWLIFGVIVILAILAFGWIEHKSTGASGPGISLTFPVGGQSPTLISSASYGPSFSGGPISNASASLINPSVGSNAQLLYGATGQL